MLNSLEEAAENGDLEICKLLVEAGAPVADLSHHCLYEVILRPLIEYLLDHGLASPETMAWLICLFIAG